MNKHQKEKSREIRDIMRSDKWGRMTYKEARRKWRKGVRAFRIGDTYTWKAADISHLGFSRKQLKEVGKAYHKVLVYCSERSLLFSCYYEACFDSYVLRFSGWSVDGKKYGISQSITGDLIRQYRGSLMDITERLLETVNDRLREFTLPSVIKTESSVGSLYPRMTIYPWDARSVENVFSQIIVKEE